MNHYLYLFLDLIAFLSTLVLSFEKRLKFISKWRSNLIAISITALIFIAWDIYFTKMGVWGFNEYYLCGIQLLELPLEEILFFFCIPYACLLTYDATRYFCAKHEFNRFGYICSRFAIILSVFVLIRYQHLAYTFSSFLLLFVLVLIDSLSNKQKLIGKFAFAYLFILIPFFIINGILTGTGLESPVVWYDNSENFGIRILTIPIEDFVYGFDLVFMSLLIRERLAR